MVSLTGITELMSHDESFHNPRGLVPRGVLLYEVAVEVLNL